jgi:MATE family multidrug resistance protein
VRRAAVLTAGWGVGAAFALAVVFWALGPLIIDAMATAPDVRAAARVYLPWLVIAPLVGVASYMYDGIFIGATRTRAMRNAMAGSVAIYVVALLVLVPLAGNHGLWAALMVLNIARGLWMAALYPALLRGVA